MCKHSAKRTSPTLFPLNTVRSCNPLRKVSELQIFAPLPVEKSPPSLLTSVPYFPSYTQKARTQERIIRARIKSPLEVTVRQKTKMSHKSTGDAVIKPNSPHNVEKAIKNDQHYRAISNHGILISKH